MERTIKTIDDVSKTSTVVDILNTTMTASNLGEMFKGLLGTTVTYLATEKYLITKSILHDVLPKTGPFKRPLMFVSFGTRIAVSAAPTIVTVKNIISGSILEKIRDPKYNIRAAYSNTNNMDGADLSSIREKNIEKTEYYIDPSQMTNEKEVCEKFKKVFKNVFLNEIWYSIELNEIDKDLKSTH